MICSGVSTYGSEASAPAIGSCVSRLRPTGDQKAPVATTTSSAPYSRTPSASSRRPVSTSTFLSFSSWMRRQLRAAPLAAAGELRDPAHDPADGVLGVHEMDAPEAALAEHDRALHPARPGADDEHVAVAVLGGLEALWVPAAAELLARGRVLRAPDVAARVGLGDADVAADALADLVEAALLDLQRQKRVSDRRPRGADHVPGAARDDLRHRSGSVRRETPTIGFAVASRTCFVHRAASPA